MLRSIESVQQAFRERRYITDRSLATIIYLSGALGKPLLLEGEAGVGKTEVAKVMAAVLDTDLIRLQCYEGLDANTALYEWNYPKQMLHIKIAEATQESRAEVEKNIFSEEFLIRRPLLEAIYGDYPQAPVLLIDEIDRCVSAGTLVATTAGIKRAEEIRAGDELVSFDPEGFQLAHARIKKAIPRGTSIIVRLLVGGRFLEVTPEHRFVRYSEAGHEVVRASELRVGDRLPLHKALYPVETEEPRLDFSDAIIPLTEAGKRLLHSAYKASGESYQQIATAVGVSRQHLRNVLQPRSCRNSLRAGVLQKLSDVLGLDGTMGEPRYARGLRICQSVAFYELLGYIVADGCFSSDRVCIADKDRVNLEIYARKFEEAFGDPPKIQQGPHRNFELTYHSLPLGRFLRRALGKGLDRSRERIVPAFVFLLPAEKRAGFVRGFFDGEGWVADHQISAVSASPYLLVGMQQLLSSLGVDSHISQIRSRAGSFGRGPYFVLAISDIGAFATAVGFCSPAKKRLIEGHRDHAFTRTETLPRTRVVNALNQLRERTVLHRVPSHQTIYDVLAGRIRPNVSSIRRIAESFDSPELRDLLDREIVLGEVTWIETLEAPQTVYDFVLEGQPYFVANQVITHNCDEEFEAFLLEVLSDFQISIPEIGTITAKHRPYVVLTSNRTREVHDALKRRCLYHWIDYPSFQKELEIVQAKVPEIREELGRQICGFMGKIRQMDFFKRPGVAETLDWAQALLALHRESLDETTLRETLGCIFKYNEDIRKFTSEVLGGKAAVQELIKEWANPRA